MSLPICYRFLFILGFSFTFVVEKCSIGFCVRVCDRCRLVGRTFISARFSFFFSKLWEDFFANGSFSNFLRSFFNFRIDKTILVSLLSIFTCVCGAVRRMSFLIYHLRCRRIRVRRTMSDDKKMSWLPAKCTRINGTMAVYRCVSLLPLARAIRKKMRFFVSFGRRYFCYHIIIKHTKWPEK